MLISLANQFSQSIWKRHLLFLGAAALAILSVGYHYGTFDMAIHIPFLNAMADPTLFPNDSYIALRNNYFSYFWLFFIPFEQIGRLPEALFIVHTISIYLTFWAVWEISTTLFHDPLASFLSVLAFIGPHIGFVGFPVIEFGVMSRTFVMPFLLFAINFFLQRRILLAFLLTGLMYNLHVVTVNFILAMFLLDCVIEFKRIGIKNILLGWTVFVLAALPVLIWKSTAAPIDFSLRPEWYAFLVRTILLNVFVLFSAQPQIIMLTWGGFSCFGLFLAARRRHPITSLEPTIHIFVAAIFIILLVGQIMGIWLPMTILIQSQINRAGLFLLILAYIYFAGYLAQNFQTETKRERVLPEILILLTSPTPILVILIVLIQKILPATRRVQMGLSIATIIISISAFAINFYLQTWDPKIEIYSQNTPWVDVQVWARTHTPKEALFITPPEKFGFYESDWRVYSERSTFVTYSELLVAAFNPFYTNGWMERFNALAPGAMDKFDGNYFANTAFTKDAYYTLTAAHLKELACTHKVSYIVREKPHLLPFTLAYQNQQFSIYDLTAGICQK